MTSSSENTEMIPTAMRLVALSINTAKRAGTIIKDIMQTGNLGVVEKVGKFYTFFLKKTVMCSY